MTTEKTIDAKTSAIAAAMLSVTRVMNQLRAHETLCKQAGVELDRGGSALLYKLYSEGDNARPTELAERLGVDPPTVTRKVQQLERAGLISRQADPGDARACRLSLTPQGRDSIERLLRARERWFDEMLEGWPEKDKDQFAGLLHLFTSTMAKDLEHRD